MKIVYLFILTLAMSLQTSFGQDSRVRTLTAVGRGEIQTAPDLVVLNLELSAKNMDFNKAIEELNKKAAALEKQVVAAGFKKEDLKTTSYTVNKNYEYHNGRSVDSGFIAHHAYTLEFPNEQTKIVAVVKAISKGIEVSYNFGFTLSDAKKKEVKAELLKRAVKEATEEANVLAAASGVKLKQINEITYGLSEIVPVAMANVRMAKMSAESDFAGFEAKDISLSEKVTITWELAQ